MTYGGTRRDGDNVVRCGIVGVVLSNILQCRLSGIDDHGGTVDSPEDKILAVRVDRSEADGKSLCLGGKGCAWDILDGLGNNIGLVETAGRWVGSSLGGWICDSNAGVSKDGAAGTVVGTLAVTISISTEPVVARGLVGGNNNIVALANSDLEVVCGIWDNRNKVMSNHLEGMAIKRNTESGIDSSIDETEAVLLAGSKRDLVVGSAARCVLVLSVDQDVVTCWGRSAITAIESTGTGLVSGNVVPILHHLGSEVDVVVGGGRSVNNERGNHTVTVLSAEVRVVPGSSVLGSLEDVGF